jgi:MarR family transcriptional regulator for hemolysin
MNELRSFGFLIKDLSRLYTRRFEERARPLGLTLSQCKVLVYLGRNEGISQSKLGELTEIEPMNLVRILDHMESEGWLERRPDPADRRARRLFLQPRSASLIGEIWSISDALRGEVFKGIPAQQAKLLVTLLAQLHHNVLSMEPQTADGAAATSALPTELKAAARRTSRARNTVKS